MKKSNKRNTKHFRKKLKSKNSILPLLQQNGLISKINKIFSDKRFNQLMEHFNNSLDRKLVNQISKELINLILTNKDIITKFYKIPSNRENYKNHFKQFILLPYYVIGNKYMDRFDEFYDFISQFNFFEKGKKIILFRCMDENEYKNIIIGGEIQSPSYSSNPQYITYLKVNNTILNLDVKSVFVCCFFNTEDLISDIPFTTEGEILVKKGSKPILIKKYSEFSKDDLDDVFGVGVKNYLPLLPSELANGFDYMNSLTKKGFVTDLEYIMKGNQHIHKNPTNWIIKHTKELTSILEELESLKKQFTITNK